MNNLLEKFYQSSISLKNIGLDGLSWKKSDILNVLDYLENNNIAILGGDVYICSDKYLSRTYDSWYLNQDSLPWEDYIKKSHDITKSYIENYNKRNGDNYAYSLVIEQKFK